MKAAVEVLLRGLGHLVPRDRRGTWLREWRAELGGTAGARGGRGEAGRSAWRVLAAATEDALALRRAHLSASMRAGLSRHPAGSGAPGNRTRGDGWIRVITRDFARAVRSLGRSPLFAGVAILTIGLGIGMNAAIFSVVNSVLLQPLPYEEPAELVEVSNRYWPAGSTGWVSRPEYWEYRQQREALAASAPLTSDAANLTGLPTPLRLEGLMVGTDFFRVLGERPALGRGFVEEEGQPGGDPVVVLGHGLWQSALGGDPAIVGRTIQLDGESRTVVGVMGPEYEPLTGYLFPGRAEQYFIPLVLDPAAFDSKMVEQHNMLVLGRLARGVDPDEAERLLLEAVRRLESRYPGLSKAGSRDVAVRSLHDAVTGPVKGLLLLLAVAAGLVLLVACVNVTNLLLARADARKAEVAVRAAMGAGRKRLVWHGLSESLVIGVAGALVGVLLALLARDTLLRLVPAETPLPRGLGVGPVVVAFTLGLSLLAAALAGVIPALRAGRGDLFAALKSGGRESSRETRALLRRGLVVGQVAGAVVLVVSAVLLLRSLFALQAVESGFEPRGLYAIQVNATSSAFPEAADVGDLYRAIERRVEELPGVEAVGASWQTPLQDGMSDWPVMPRRSGESEWFSADPNLVGPGFFEAYGIDIVEGRGFEPGDMERGVGPVILNRTAAERLWGGEAAVGRFVNLSFGEPEWRDVIGVVEDVRGRGLAQEPRVQTYMTYGNGPWGRITSLVLNVRASADPNTLRRGVAEVVGDLDGNIPLGPIQSMEAVVSASVERERLLSVLLAVFGTVALLLGAIGVYGVISYSVARRTRELGLRIAIGAPPRSVVGLVVRDGVFMGVLGVLLGVAGAVAAGRLLEGFLFGVAGSDRVTLVTVAVAVLGVATLASFLPARRAAGVDPLKALRD